MDLSSFHLQIEVSNGFKLFFLSQFNKKPLNNVVFFACSLTTEKIEFSSFKKASNGTWVLSWAHTPAHIHTHTYLINVHSLALEQDNLQKFSSMALRILSWVSLQD